MEHSEGVYTVLLWFILLILREAYVVVVVAEEGACCTVCFLPLCVTDITASHARKQLKYSIPPLLNFPSSIDLNYTVDNFSAERCRFLDILYFKRFLSLYCTLSYPLVSCGVVWCGVVWCGVVSKEARTLPMIFPIIDEDWSLCNFAAMTVASCVIM